MGRVAERSAVLLRLAELFRTRGFDGASLSAITAATGLGKGSLYHLFPGGKDEMADAVLAEIDRWFAGEVFAPLREAADAGDAIERMLSSVAGYFRSGDRICLVGAFALGDTRDRFAERVRGYFAEWRDALAAALRRRGVAKAPARDLAEETVAAIQGALVLARALDDPAVFQRSLERSRRRLREAAPR